MTKEELLEWAKGMLKLATAEYKKGYSDSLMWWGRMCAFEDLIEEITHLRTK